MFKEFKEFAMKGNLVDLAVGFILGGAFATVVKSLVGDVIMPPVGLAMGGVDFSQLTAVLKPAEINAAGEVVSEEVAIRYGNFINEIISFLIVAFAMFFIVKGMNELQKAEENAPEEPAEPPKEQVSLTDHEFLPAKP
ncbi:MAG: large-conductance mechanosensitive channel protein MscL, partial [Pseudomonadota bacterium]